MSLSVLVKPAALLLAGSMMFMPSVASADRYIPLVKGECMSGYTWDNTSKPDGTCFNLKASSTGATKANKAGKETGGSNKAGSKN